MTKTGSTSPTTNRRARRTPARGQVAAPPAGRRGAAGFAGGAPPEPDLEAALNSVLALLPIPGPSGQEGAVAAWIVAQLLAAGAPAAAIAHDTAHRRTQPPGQVGNLVLKLPGTLAAPRRMLVAHLDMVPLCVCAQPVRQGAHVRAADSRTALGADNRAGCAVLLCAAREILRYKLPHPPLTLLWCVQEEVGLRGARHAQVARWGRPRLAFNFDGGPADKLSLGATGAYRLAVEFTGHAAHAGGAPEKGASAITMAALAVEDLHRRGWLGQVRHGTHQGTANIGIIAGGEATNVVTPHLNLRAEVRSHDPRFRRRMLREFERAFARAARQVRTQDGQSGRVTIESRLDYESFCLRPDEPCVLAAEAALRSVGHEPVGSVSNGGLDANWITAHGVPTVTLGCGQRQVHTTQEELDVAQFQLACRVGLRLATASEGLWAVAQSR